MNEIKTLNFIKEDTGSWFIDLPDWTGSKAELAMVAGADTLLDTLSNGESLLSILVSKKPRPGFSMLKKLFNTPFVGGATYINNGDITKPLWLCRVTEFVLGGMPKRIYYKLVL
jgi:hypothetical protein